MCDRPATTYVGKYAYCAGCAHKSRDSHCCPECGEAQPSNVSWHANYPCKKCQEKRRDPPPATQAN